MITDAVLDYFFALIGSILDLLPQVTVPSWMSAGGPISKVFTYAGQMGAWFPMSEAVTIVGALLGVWVVGFGIKVTRIILSFLTFGGGSAA